MAKRGRTSGPAKILSDQPTLWKSSIGYWEAFQRLSTCRPLGMGPPGPIPWVAINAYAERYGYYGLLFDELVHYVEFLDGIYLQHAASKSRVDA